MRIKDYRRPIVNAIIGFVLFAGVAATAQYAYYKIMPGEHFLNYYYVKVDNTPVGADVQLTVCRSTKFTNFRAYGTRTFTRVSTEATPVEVSEYEFTPIIERVEGNCVAQTIDQKYQPQEPGKYKIHTELTFKAGGQSKTIQYNSNEYQVYDTKESLEEKIRRLEEEIMQLKKQLAIMDSGPNTAVRSSAPQQDPPANPLRRNTATFQPQNRQQNTNQTPGGNNTGGGGGTTTPEPNALDFLVDGAQNTIRDIDLNPFD